jgi:hypothetical protein
MTAQTLTTSRPRRARRALAPVLVLVLAGAGAAACAQESGDAGVTIDDGGGDGTEQGGDARFSATSEFLASAAAQSSAEPFRIEMDMAVSAMGTDIDADNLVVGQTDGDRGSFTMDFSAMFEDAPGASEMFGDAEPTMDMVFDGTALYMRSAIFATMADAGITGEDLGPMAALADLGDQWGRVDLDALGEDVSLSDVASSTGAQAADPHAFLDMVTNATDPHELGSDTLRGDHVQGIGATITFGDMLEAEGQDAGSYLDTAGTSGGLGAAASQAVFDTEMPVEVWVDDDDHVRQVAVSMDMDQVMESLDAPGASASFELTMDFFDYGDPTIAIEVPTESVDITDAYAELLTQD